MVRHAGVDMNSCSLQLNVKIKLDKVRLEQALNSRPLGIPILYIYV